MTNLTKEEQIAGIDAAIKVARERANEEYNLEIDKIIPPRFKNVKAEDIPANILDKLKSDSKKNGLYIWGSPGVGKTHLGYALLRYKMLVRLNKTFEQILKLGNEKKENTEDPYFNYAMPWFSKDINLYNFIKILREIKNTMDKPEGEKCRLEDYNDSHILILDDIGAEKFTEWSIEQLYDLVNTRYEKMLPTIFISNLSLNDLVEKVGDRIPSRIAEMCHIVKIEGKDRRLD